MFPEKVKNLVIQYKILLCLVLIFLSFRLYNFSHPILDAHSFRQTQTATMALNFYKNGINLFQTELDIFGTGKEKHLTLEFPLYEATVAVFYKIFFVNDIWGRVVSILSGFIGAWYLFRLVALLIRNDRMAILASFFFLAAPLNMFYQRSFMMEPTIIALLLSGLYYFCHFVNYLDRKSVVFSVILLSLGFIHKGIYGPFLLLPMVIYYLKKRSFRGLFSLRYLFIFIIPLIVLIYWQKHVDYINAVNGHEYFTSYNKGQVEWNVGTFADRLSIPIWKTYFGQLLNGILLKPGLLIFLIGFIQVFRIDKNGFFVSWFFSQIIYLTVFFRIQSHNYYQMIMTPVFSIIMSIGLVIMSDWIKWRHLKIPLISVFCVIFIYKSWINTLPSFYIDWEWYNRLKAVGNSVPKEAVGILATPGFDWNSVFTYIPGRKMLAVEAEKVTPKSVAEWKSLGYSFLVLHEYEKFPAYFAGVKPGYSLDFLNSLKLSLDIAEFKIYQF